MENNILGLHHITAIAGDAQRNYDFYTGVLGLRLVKKTVNFDDPGTYHFYFGNETGSPGTILTFFPWTGVQRGRTGTGMATEIGYSVPAGSLSFWKQRLETAGVQHTLTEGVFGESFITFEDPDGLVLKLVEKADDNRAAWLGSDVKADAALKGFHSVTLELKNKDATARVLTQVLGYKSVANEGNRTRFVTDTVATANVVDLVEDSQGRPGVTAGGTNHHVAFRVQNEEDLMKMRQKVLDAGMYITEKIDRNYFYSLYFREPGGVLFEIASDNPGFATDEKVEELGTHLMLPAQYEKNRQRIEKVLPVLHQ